MFKFSQIESGNVGTVLDLIQHGSSSNIARGPVVFNSMSVQVEILYPVLTVRSFAVQKRPFQIERGVLPQTRSWHTAKPSPTQPPPLL